MTDSVNIIIRQRRFLHIEWTTTNLQRRFCITSSQYQALENQKRLSAFFEQSLPYSFDIVKARESSYVERTRYQRLPVNRCKTIFSGCFPSGNINSFHTYLFVPFNVLNLHRNSSFENKKQLIMKYFCDLNVKWKTHLLYRHKQYVAVLQARITLLQLISRCVLDLLKVLVIHRVNFVANKNSSSWIVILASRIDDKAKKVSQL